MKSSKPEAVVIIIWRVTRAHAKVKNSRDECVCVCSAYYAHCSARRGKNVIFAQLQQHSHFNSSCRDSPWRTARGVGYIFAIGIIYLACVQGDRDIAASGEVQPSLAPSRPTVVQIDARKS